MKYSDLVPYFKDRLYELFHAQSLDSYRVRHHNTFSILFELKELIIAWGNKNIKSPDTLIYSLDETLKLAESDTVFDFTSYSLKCLKTFISEFKGEIKDTAKKDKSPSERSTHLVFILNKLIEDNKRSYLKRLWDNTQTYIFREEEFDENKDFIKNVEPLEKLTVSLAREILNRGYSRTEAFEKCKKYLNENNSLKAFKKFRGEFLYSPTKDFSVILSIYIVGAHRLDSFGVFYESIERTSLAGACNDEAKLSKFIEPSTNKLLFKTECKATDAAGAIKEAKRQLFTELDAIFIGIPEMNVQFNNQAAVEFNTRSGKKIIFKPTRYALEGHFKSDEKTALKCRDMIHIIQNSPVVNNDVKIRLQRALRHLRIGNTSSELEQQFINYWIALEYLFSSPISSESTFARIKENLTNILSACYIKRNLENIESILRIKGILANEENLTKENVDVTRDNADSILLKYRISTLKRNIFVNSNKTKEYVANHRNDLLAHLSRIYHLRNELIHEAAIKQDIEDLTSNLKYYLVFVLNQMIGYFAHSDVHTHNVRISIDEFFYRYRMIYETITDNWDFSGYRTISYYDSLLK